MITVGLLFVGWLALVIGGIGFFHVSQAKGKKLDRLEDQRRIQAKYGGRGE